MRLPKNLNQSLNRKSKPFSMEEIPVDYVLGQGHVKFFFNKFGYLKNRFSELVSEMHLRGFNPSYTDSSIFNVDKNFMGNYKPTTNALKINRIRIKERTK
jgi:hypothetical protein